MKEFPSHAKKLVALRRIEGQVRGIQKMIEERKYCVDIITQISAVRGALARVEDTVLENHLEHCVTDAIKGSSSAERDTKIKEVIKIIQSHRKK